MPVYIVKAPNGQDVEMTSDMPPTYSQKAAIFKEAGLEARGSSVQPQSTARTGDGSALAMQGAASAVPSVLNAAEEVATNPRLVRGAGTAGEVAGAVAGLAKGSPTAAYVESRVGGKIGRAVAPALQKIASPVASILEKAAPYAQALSTASGAQGALDLAQMAEPNRKDIGVLGVGIGDPGDPEHPALLNLIATKIGEAVKSLVAKGMSEKEAVRTVLNLKAKGR